MKRTLVKISLFCIAIVLFGIIFFRLIAFHGSILDKESKLFIDQLIPSIITEWNARDLVQHASPEFLKVSPEPSLLSFFRMLEQRLGKLKKFSGSEGEATISLSLTKGKKNFAQYRLQAEFEKGPATIDVGLVKNHGKWQVLSFRVNSDLIIT